MSSFQSGHIKIQDVLAGVEIKDLKNGTQVVVPFAQLSDIAKALVAHAEKHSLLK